MLPYHHYTHSFLPLLYQSLPYTYNPLKFLKIASKIKLPSVFSFHDNSSSFVQFQMWFWYLWRRGSFKLTLMLYGECIAGIYYHRVSSIVLEIHVLCNVEPLAVQ